MLPPLAPGRSRPADRGDRRLGARGLAERLAGLIADVANRLSDRDVPRIYKRRAVAVGMEEIEEIAGHSTRIGAAQDMLAAGYGEAEIVHEVGWTDARRLYHYTQHMQAVYCRAGSRPYPRATVCQ